MASSSKFFRNADFILGDHFLEYGHHTMSSEKKGQMTSERRLLAVVVRREAPLVQIDLGHAARRV